MRREIIIRQSFVLSYFFVGVAVLIKILLACSLRGGGEDTVLAVKVVSVAARRQCVASSAASLFHYTPPCDDKTPAAALVL